MNDLIAINKYTLEVSGMRQSDLYELELRACCKSVAAAPYLGRRCQGYGSDVRRMEQGSHVISTARSRVESW